MGADTSQLHRRRSWPAYQPHNSLRGMPQAAQELICKYHVCTAAVRKALLPATALPVSVICIYQFTPRSICYSLSRLEFSNLSQ